jgi:hypothetical protein
LNPLLLFPDFNLLAGILTEKKITGFIVRRMDCPLQVNLPEITVRYTILMVHDQTHIFFHQNTAVTWPIKCRLRTSLRIADYVVRQVLVLSRNVSSKIRWQKSPELQNFPSSDFPPRYFPLAFGSARSYNSYFVLSRVFYSRSYTIL